MNKNSNDIIDWMANYINDITGKKMLGSKLEAPFNELGLDSAAVINMTGDLSEWLGIEIDPTIAYEFPTIRSFSENVLLAEEVKF